MMADDGVAAIANLPKWEPSITTLAKFIRSIRQRFAAGMSHTIVRNGPNTNIMIIPLFAMSTIVVVKCVVDDHHNALYLVQKVISRADF